MTKEEDGYIVTDQDALIDRKIDLRIKPILIMSGCTEERIIRRIDRLEDLVIRKRLFYRKVVLGVIIFIVSIIIIG